MKPISRRQHGFVDYGVAALELALAQALPAGRRARLMLRVSAVNAALLGMLTRYELGVVKVIPMRVHLALDAVFAAGFLAAPLLLDEEDAGVRATLAALGATGAAVAALTDPDL